MYENAWLKQKILQSTHIKSISKQRQQLSKCTQIAQIKSQIAKNPAA